MADYREHRLSDNDDRIWMIDAMHSMTFVEYIKYENKVFTALDKLTPGKYYDLSELPEENIDVFIKLCCIYIQDHPELCFSEKYDKIYKDEQWIMDSRAKGLLKQKCREVDSTGNCIKH